MNDVVKSFENFDAQKKFFIIISTYYKISLKNRYTNGQKFLKECSFLWTFYVFASLRNILSV